MATRIIYTLAILAAVVEGLAGNMLPAGLFPAIMVILGAAYALMNIDAAQPHAFLTTALVVAAAGWLNVLSENLPMIGGYLDAIVDEVAVVYLSGGVAILGMRAWNLITKGSL